jgi:hypothetical protein
VIFGGFAALLHIEKASLLAPLQPRREDTDVDLVFPGEHVEVVLRLSEEEILRSASGMLAPPPLLER